MEVDFSSVEWNEMEPMERFEFYYDKIAPVVSNFWEYKAQELGRNEAFPLVIEYTSDLFSCTVNDIGVSRYQRQPSTSTGLFMPKKIYHDFFEKHQRQWVGIQRKKQAQIIADDYINQIEEIVNSKRLDGFTNIDIEKHVYQPRIKEIEQQINELSLPGNKCRDNAHNNVIVKSRFIVLKYLRQKIKTPSLKDEGDFLSLYEIAIYCRYRGIKVSKNDNPRDIIELKNILNERKGTGIAGHISKLPKPSRWLSDRDSHVKNDNFRISLIKVKKVLEANGRLAEAKKVSEDIEHFSFKHSLEN